MSRINESGAPADRALIRDAALARISRTRRWALAAAAALTAGLAALASALLPGKSFGAHSRSAQSGTTSASNPALMPPLPAPANAAQLGLTASAQAPQAAPAPQPAPAAPAPQAAPQPQSAAQPQQAPSSGGGTVVVSGGS